MPRGPTAGRRPGRTRPCWCRRACRPRESGAASWRHYTPADYTFLTAISTRRTRRLTIGRASEAGFRTDAGAGGRGQRRSRQPRDEGVGPGRPRCRRDSDRRRCRGLVAHGAVCRRGARSRPARRRRTHPARPDAPAARPDAGPHPVGARRTGRPGRRPQQGRQRLHGEAVLDGRTYSPPAGPAAPLARPRRPDADLGQRRAQDRWSPGRRRRPDAEPAGARGRRARSAAQAQRQGGVARLAAGPGLRLVAGRRLQRDRGLRPSPAQDPGRSGRERADPHDPRRRLPDGRRQSD